MDAMGRIDVLSALRSLRRSPGVSLAAVLSLAFGIAASCAVFSVVDALLLQPLPFADPASLVFATETTGPDHALNAVSGPDLVDWRSRAQSFAELGGFRRTQVTLTRLEAPERVDAAAVQPGVFSALRVPPVLGRTLVAADDLPGAPRVAVISHRFWRTRLSGDGTVLERSVTLAGQPVRIVGVMPEGFRFPLDGPAPELWLQPRAVQFGNMLDERALFFFQVVGRLRPGATVEGGRAELAAITTDISARNPESHVQRGVLVVPLREQLVGADRGSLVLLLGAVGVLLVIACTNVGSLLLDRAAHLRDAPRAQPAQRPEPRRRRLHGGPADARFDLAGSERSGDSAAAFRRLARRARRRDPRSASRRHRLAAASGRTCHRAHRRSPRPGGAAPAAKLALLAGARRALAARGEARSGPRVHRPGPRRRAAGRDRQSYARAPLVARQGSDRAAHRSGTGGSGESRSGRGRRRHAQRARRARGAADLCPLCAGALAVLHAGRAQRSRPRGIAVVVTA